MDEVFLLHVLTVVCQLLCETLAVDIAISHVERTDAAAQWRRDRMVRSGWRHDPRSIEATVATMLHHSAGRKHLRTVVNAATQVGDTRAAGSSMPTIFDPCSFQATAQHATRVWSQWECGYRMS